MWQFFCTYLCLTYTYTVHCTVAFEPAKSSVDDKVYSFQRSIGISFSGYFNKFDSTEIFVSKNLLLTYIGTYLLIPFDLPPNATSTFVCTSKKFVHLLTPMFHIPRKKRVQVDIGFSVCPNVGACVRFAIGDK